MCIPTRSSNGATSFLKQRPVYLVIRMEDQPRRRPSAEPGRAQCVDHQGARHPLAHRKAYDLATEQIDHHHQIKPAIVDPDIGDVAITYIIFGTFWDLTAPFIEIERRKRWTKV